jgi:hypothetical protein
MAKVVWPDCSCGIMLDLAKYGIAHSLYKHHVTSAGAHDILTRCTQTYLFGICTLQCYSVVDQLIDFFQVSYNDLCVHIASR